jgi:hypothetical protein
VLRRDADVELQSLPPSGPVPYRTEHPRVEIADVPVVMIAISATAALGATTYLAMPL